MLAPIADVRTSKNEAVGGECGQGTPRPARAEEDAGKNARGRQECLPHQENAG
jgi:hypothetical protein